jgi:excisionase family DNA binding protein
MNMITTTEAATRLGVNQSRIRQLILSARLVAQKRGRDWMIEVGEIERFLRERRSAGRPRIKNDAG